MRDTASDLVKKIWRRNGSVKRSDEVRRKRVESLWNVAVSTRRGQKQKCTILTRERSLICSGFHSNSSSSALELFQLSVLRREGAARKRAELTGEPQMGVRGADPFEATERREERLVGRGGWGRTIASGETPGARRVCIVICG